jgi:hypothetical protein
VTGRSLGWETNYDYATIKYSQTRKIAVIREKPNAKQRLLVFSPPHGRIRTQGIPSPMISLLARAEPMQTTSPWLEYVIDRTHSFTNIEADTRTAKRGSVKIGSAFFCLNPHILLFWLTMLDW